MKKKSIFVWLFLFITLTTFYFDFNKTSFVESFKLKQIEINGVKNADINSINLRLEYFKDQNVFFLKQEEIANAIIDLDFINKAIDNITEDRAAAKTLLMALMKHIHQSEERHQAVGLIAAKYLETLQRSNEQLVKVASLVQKKTSKDQAITEKDNEARRLFVFLFFYYLYYQEGSS